MCGIIGYLGPQDAVEVIFQGLQRLEYRGYDSAGIAVIRDGAFEVRRSEGKLSRLGKILNEQPISGPIGIGHTRWATHGRPSETNAHPHVAGSIALVHNGIIENYLDLKNRLLKEGHRFASETDSEIVAHLIDRYARDLDLVDAVRKALEDIKGSYALVVLQQSQPQTPGGGPQGMSPGHRPGGRGIVTWPRISSPFCSTPTGSSTWKTGNWRSWNCPARKS